MNGSKFNVLLYLDEFQSAFFAVEYAAILLMNMPNMHLSVVQLKESDDGTIKTENNCLNVWPISQTPYWVKDARYHKILNKTNELFSIRAVDVSYQVIYCNPNIPDSVDALLEFVRKRSIELIVMGTEERRTLRGLIFGNLGDSLQKKSPIPVLLVNKLPQDFFDSYRSKSTLKIVRK